MAIYTDQEIIDKIKAIDISIEKAQNLTEYELDTGQGRQRTKRQNLPALYASREYWERIYTNQTEGGGIIAADYCR